MTSTLRPPVTPPVALSIAGTDSGGGAGIAADLRTFAVHRVFGTLAVTAVTAQDTTGVHGVVVIPPEFVSEQIDAAMGDFPVLAAKTGMLATLATLEMVLGRASTGRLPPLVVDPVMVATSGAQLFETDAQLAYRRLLPFALVVTPNLAEASLLAGRDINDRASMADAARALVDLGATVALVTGGHLQGPQSVDVAFDGSQVIELVDEMVISKNVHGTGCTLSAAITANLALGLDPIGAIVAAKHYLSGVIRASASWSLGEGPGPLDHMGTTTAPRNPDPGTLTSET